MTEVQITYACDDSLNGDILSTLGLGRICDPKKTTGRPQPPCGESKNDSTKNREPFVARGVIVPERSNTSDGRIRGILLNKLGKYALDRVTNCTKL